MCSEVDLQSSEQHCQLHFQTRWGWIFYFFIFFAFFKFSVLDKFFKPFLRIKSKLVNEKHLPTYSGVLVQIFQPCLPKTMRLTEASWIYRCTFPIWPCFRWFVFNEACCILNRCWIVHQNAEFYFSHQFGLSSKAGDAHPFGIFFVWLPNFGFELTPVVVLRWGSITHLGLEVLVEAFLLPLWLCWHLRLKAYTPTQKVNIASGFIFKWMFLFRF